MISTIEEFPRSATALPALKKRRVLPPFGGSEGERYREATVADPLPSGIPKMK